MASMYIKYATFFFNNGKENYIKNIAPQLRNSDIIDQPINGKKACELDNINLKGYLVNDYSFINCISTKQIKNYIDNLHNNNVIIKETKDVPIYYSIRDIKKKNEELYANYGLPYWLLQNNCNPEKIREICKKYEFSGE